jgi:hypothetical protein
MLAPTCFGHSCDHLQGVPHYKCEEYNRNRTALLVGESRDRSPVVSLGTFSEATDGTMCPGVDSASKSEYQDTPGGKDGRCVGVTTLRPS